MKILLRTSQVLLIWLMSLIYFVGPVSADLVVIEPTCRPDQGPNANFCIESSQKLPIPVNEELSLAYIISGVVVVATIFISVLSLRQISQKPCSS